MLASLASFLIMVDAIVGKASITHWAFFRGGGGGSSNTRTNSVPKGGGGVLIRYMRLLFESECLLRSFVVIIQRQEILPGSLIQEGPIYYLLGY